ncbi:hypothetical protein BKA56DRAFT_75702 [Ilyonectria sp. MPI-CAGE-AT-0026]|nr:hypothetical protein BKA56DRAFT_75702 [Ilyonectria sp. MPI-CAGE-AT-0026]
MGFRLLISLPIQHTLVLYFCLFAPRTSPVVFAFTPTCMTDTPNNGPSSRRTPASKKRVQQLSAHLLSSSIDCSNFSPSTAFLRAPGIWSGIPEVLQGRQPPPPRAQLAALA